MVMAHCSLSIKHVGHLHVDELGVGVHQHGDDVLVPPVRGPVEEGQALRISNPGVGDTQPPYPLNITLLHYKIAISYTRAVSC